MPLVLLLGLTQENASQFCLDAMSFWGKVEKSPK